MHGRVICTVFAANMVNYTPNLEHLSVTPIIVLYTVSPINIVERKNRLVGDGLGACLYNIRQLFLTALVCVKSLPGQSDRMEVTFRPVETGHITVQYTWLYSTHGCTVHITVQYTYIFTTHSCTLHISVQYTVHIAVQCTVHLPVQYT